jgi:hypothetical protein
LLLRFLKEPGNQGRELYALTRLIFAVKAEKLLALNIAVKRLSLHKVVALPMLPIDVIIATLRKIFMIIATHQVVVGLPMVLIKRRSE